MPTRHRDEIGVSIAVYDLRPTDLSLHRLADVGYVVGMGPDVDVFVPSLAAVQSMADRLFELVGSAVDVARSTSDDR